MPAPNPQLSVVVLTWNEEPRIEACLASLSAQRELDFEVVVIDAASTDGTVAKVQALQPGFPVPLRVEVAESRIPIGEARNRGVTMAKAPCIAFMSADAEADPTWVGEVLAALRSTDMAFGRQVHAPRSLSIGAAVRGMRYHFPDTPSTDPIRFASNVNAAFRKDVLRAFPFDPATSASEDLLIAKKAYRAGYHATYQPRMVVHHRDVESAKAELRKNLREGESWARYFNDFGLHGQILAWGAGVLLTASLFALSPGFETGLLLALVVWAPTLRRAWRRRGKMPARLLALGVAASPVFDFAFLLAYLHGFLRGRRVSRDLTTTRVRPEG